MISITKLQKEDLQDLKVLYENAFQGSSTDFNKMSERFNQIKNNPDYIILCAKLNEQVIGSVMGIVCYELFGQCLPFMVVENVAVLSDYRRKGVAKQLMETLEECAIEKNCSVILLVSSEQRKDAHKLYTSLGYGIDKVNGFRKRLKKDLGF